MRVLTITEVAVWVGVLGVSGCGIGALVRGRRLRTDRAAWFCHAATSAQICARCLSVAVARWLESCQPSR